MANNKFYGYTPKKDETTVGWDKGWRTGGNRLDKINPYEFRKGMDYELTAMGVSRLQESTPEEREKATETVLKNLDIRFFILFVIFCIASFALLYPLFNTSNTPSCKYILSFIS